MFLIVIHLISFLSLTRSALSEEEEETRTPHIILIYADDLGWNDISFHGSPQVPTPNIDALAQSGILLNNYYAEWSCTPSRGALMTGQYPIRYGLQHSVIKPGERSALPLNLTLLPQYLQELGYETHMVGKWHLGYFKKEYMPTYRGFKTYLGYVNGAMDYFDYTNANDGFPPENPTDRLYFGVDFYNGTQPIDGFRGTYSTDLFTKTARDIILQHDTSKPLFFYLAEQAVHASASTQHLQAPPEVVRNFKNIEDKNRRIYAGKTAVLDDSVGRVFEALHQKNMLEDSIILFLSDNGGEVDHDLGGYGTNYPLRGKKTTLWEGGSRVPALIWSPLFKLQKPRISNQLLHVTDWLPTLYRAAGGDPSDLGDIDGHDVWEVFTDDSPSPRTEFLYNIDPILACSAYRREDLKVINGTAGEGFDLWYGPTGFEGVGVPPSMEEWVFKNGSIVRDILIQKGLWIIEDPDEWYGESSVQCQQPPPGAEGICDPEVKPCLFNITADPCEYHDISDEQPEALESMMKVIEDYQKVAVEPQSKDLDPNADPTCHNFTFVPWMEPEYYIDCNYYS